MNGFQKLRGIKKLVSQIREKNQAIVIFFLILATTIVEGGKLDLFLNFSWPSQSSTQILGGLVGPARKHQSQASIPVFRRRQPTKLLLASRSCVRCTVCPFRRSHVGVLCSVLRTWKSTCLSAWLLDVNLSSVAGSRSPAKIPSSPSQVGKSFGHPVQIQPLWWFSSFPISLSCFFCFFVAPGGCGLVLRCALILSASSLPRRYRLGPPSRCC